MLTLQIILAVYYTIADIVLLGQCFYYRGFTWRDDVAPPRRRRAKRVAAPEEDQSPCATEQTSLLASEQSPYQQQHQHQHQHHHNHLGEHRRPSWSALSPAVPFAPVLDGPSSASESPFSPAASTAPAASASSPANTSTSATSLLQAVAFNAVAILMVCAAGVAGWYLSSGGREKAPDSDSDSGSDDPLTFSVWGQVFGYFCAVLYLGSRLPQLLLNWRRQSTEGVSMLFFLFACLGNLTYVLSIFAHEDHGDYTPDEARRRYGRYLLVNLSWLAGSLGTLLLDMGIFIQFFLYRQVGDDEDDSDYDSAYDEEEYEEDDDDETDVATADGRGPDGRETYQSFDQPLLQRNMSHYG